jgi:hypothetical protein
MPDELRDRITHWTALGYRVVSETPTSAQLVRPKRFNAAEFVAMPLYALEYLGQREQQVYLSMDTNGAIAETGSGTQVSRYRRAQEGMSGAARLMWVVIVFVVVIVLILAIQAVT